MFRANQQNRSSEHEQERPAETDNAPRRLIFNVTVSDEAACTVDGQVSQTHIFKLLAKQTQNKADQHRELVTEEIRAAEFPGGRHYLEPVIPWLLVTVAGSASLSP